MSAEFMKNDADKNRLELIPPCAILALGRAMSFGARKYSPGNWALCKEPERYYGAALRHLVAWHAGEVVDAESGLSHLDHALACVAMLQGLEEGE